MFQGKAATSEYWCPAEESQPHCELELTPGESSALFRFGCGEWVADAQIDRLQALGLVERAFGQAVLTRLGHKMLDRDA